MSMLPAGHSLKSFLPDLDDLLEDPAAYLGVGPIVFGPQRMYALAAVFAVPGVAFILAYIFGKHDPERIALGVGMLLGSGVWFGWSVSAHGHSLILHREGVEVKYHDLAVWCPWALFNTDRVPHVPEVDSPFSGTILPVVSEMLPFIELRRAESVIAHGAEVKTRQFIFAGADEVVLPGRYEVAAKDVADLLLQIGRTLGHQLPRGAPPREAYRTETEEVHEPDGSGWINVRVTQLHFPPVCCDCGKATTDVMQFVVESRGGRAMRIFAPNVSGEVRVPVPVCETCQAEVRTRQSRGSVRGLLIGSLFGPLVLVLGEWVFNWGNSLSSFAALAITATGALVGSAIGNTLAFRPPVQVRDYSATSGTVRMRLPQSRICRSRRRPDAPATDAAVKPVLSTQYRYSLSVPEPVTPMFEFLCSDEIAFVLMWQLESSCPRTPCEQEIHSCHYPHGTC